MLFRSFPKLGSALEPSAPEASYVALEKIHGAQLVVGLGARGDVHVGKRKAWLRPDEPFFGWQALRAELHEAARVMRSAAVRRAFAHEDDDFVVFGELHGGRYPHPDVPPVAPFTAVQTGIWYAPDLRWSPFAALVARPFEPDGTLLAFHELAELAELAAVRVPPVLARGARAVVTAAPERFPSRVAGTYGLPSLPGNVAEGFVVWLDRRSPFSAPVAAKRKIPEMREADFDLSAAFDAGRALPFSDLAALAERLSGPARVQSAASKVGAHDLAALLDEVELDVLIDLQAMLPNTLDALSDAESARLAERIRAEAERTLAVLKEV